MSGTARRWSRKAARRGHVPVHEGQGKRALDELSSLQEAVEDVVGRLKMVRQKAALSILKQAKAIGSVYDDIKANVLIGILPHTREGRDRPAVVAIILLLIAMDVVEHGTGSRASH